MSGVAVRGLTAGYGGSVVLDRLDLHVPSGSLAAVLGTSGSGKTTLLRVLAGFIRPSRGSVSFGERVVARSGTDGPDIDVPPESRRVGIVPQEGALFPHLNVSANVGFGLPRGSRARIDEVLEMVDMRDYVIDHLADTANLAFDPPEALGVIVFAGRVSRRGSRHGIEAT